MARRAGAFGYQVKFHDPALTHCPDGLAQSCSFDALLAQADILTLHLPLTPTTHHLLNEHNLAKLKPGAALVNTSRGGLVDTDSLLQALDSGQLNQALLDVVEYEPAVPPELRGHVRVALTPHAAFYSQRSLSILKARALQTLRAMLVETASVTSDKWLRQDQEGETHA
ncbi:putative 2-hydroxyacid dehydrogenase [compost metagenome]